MQHLNALFLAAAIITSCGSASLAQARQVEPAHAAMAMSEGEIKAVDKQTGKLTIRHGELKNLGMPGMTMMFKVQDPSMLDRVKQGDKVRFVADRVNGALTVTTIEVVQ